MSITYTWRVTGIKTANQGELQNAVVQTYWEKIGTDENGVEGRFSGATPFSLANMTPENFIPFDQLTEQKVLEWIQSVVVGGYEEHVNGVIEEQIREKSTAITSTPLPWAQQPQA